MNRREWAQRLVAGLDHDLRADFAVNPAQALRDHLGMKVAASEHLSRRGSGGWCDGLSFTEDGEILYAPTPYSKRENFTIGHEFGHHLVDGETDEDILVWSADLEAKEIEEVCDLVASRLLLPDEVVAEALGGRHPTGAGAALLHQTTPASRQAVAVALASRLPCEGFVALMRDGRISFAARQGDTRPYAWRDDDVPSNHPVLSLAPGQEAAVETFWAAPWGDRRRFYMSAARQGAWTFAVFAEHDLFEASRLHLPEPVRGGAQPERHPFRCPSCGYDRHVRRWPCPTCHQVACPACQECECTRRERATKRAACRHCTMSVRVALLVDGLCDQCR